MPLNASSPVFVSHPTSFGQSRNVIAYHISRSCTLLGDIYLYLENCSKYFSLYTENSESSLAGR